ncbi:hypothetical protein BKA64DRAFT_716646 [Cadophora sp. MPI-SDFR-AT-0126]|nr:hypothetical protein BKA64DRAFT_716646 [Leotiomycetes sp. MPI-SDFR-AT-0126]
MEVVSCKEYDELVMYTVHSASSTQRVITNLFSVEADEKTGDYCMKKKAVWLRARHKMIKLTTERLKDNILTINEVARTIGLHADTIVEEYPDRREQCPWIRDFFSSPLPEDATQEAMNKIEEFLKKCTPDANLKGKRKRKALPSGRQRRTQKRAKTGSVSRSTPGSSSQSEELNHASSSTSAESNTATDLSTEVETPAPVSTGEAAKPRTKMILKVSGQAPNAGSSEQDAANHTGPTATNAPATGPSNASGQLPGQQVTATQPQDPVPVVAWTTLLQPPSGLLANLLAFYNTQTGQIDFPLVPANPTPAQLPPLLQQQIQTWFFTPLDSGLERVLSAGYGDKPDWADLEKRLEGVTGLKKDKILKHMLICCSAIMNPDKTGKPTSPEEKDEIGRNAKNSILAAMRVAWRNDVGCQAWLGVALRAYVTSAVHKWKGEVWRAKKKGQVYVPSLNDS